MPPKKDTGKELDMAEMVEKLQEQLDLAQEKLAVAEEKAVSAEKETEDLHRVFSKEAKELQDTMDKEKKSLKDTYERELVRLQEELSKSTNRRQSFFGRDPEQPGYGEVPRRAHSVPPPRQNVFDGSTSWESFIKPFTALSSHCEWPEEEKLFRLTSCLRGEAAEYVFNELGSDVSETFSSLTEALASRFTEKRVTSSWLAQLESRKLGPKENLSEYIADLKKMVGRGYPTADTQTKESIAIRHFYRGLPDQQAVMFIGMSNPATIEDARAALDTYNGLRDDSTSKPPRVRAVAFKQDDAPPQLADFQTALQKLQEKLDQVEKKLTARSGPRKKRADIECYNCHEKGHFARECPTKKPEASGEPKEKEPKQEN